METHGGGLGAPSQARMGVIPAAQHPQTPPQEVVSSSGELPHRQALAVGEAPRSVSQPHLCWGLVSQSSSQAGALPPPALHWPQKEIPKGKE